MEAVFNEVNSFIHLRIVRKEFPYNKKLLDVFEGFEEEKITYCFVTASRLKNGKND